MAEVAYLGRQYRVVLDDGFEVRLPVCDALPPLDLTANRAALIRAAEAARDALREPAPVVPLRSA